MRIGGYPVKAGDVRPGDFSLYSVKKRLPFEFSVEGDRRVEKIGEQGLAFADQKEVKEVGEGFGIQGDGNAAADHQRGFLASRLRRERDRSHIEDL